MSDRQRQPAPRGRIVLRAFGATTLVLLYRIWPQLSPHHAGFYHSFLPMQTVFWGLLIDLGVATLVFTLLFLYLEQAENGVRNALWAFIAAELVPPLLQNAAALWRTALPNTYMDWAFYGSLGTALILLVLADNVLGELMDVIDATALAPDTTVIVCSDHSWRTALWQDTPQWSAEEEAAIRRNRFDPRPVLMIHSPGQKEAREIRQPFPELRLHGILEEMLRTPKQKYGAVLR